MKIGNPSDMSAIATAQVATRDAAAAPKAQVEGGVASTDRKARSATTGVAVTVSSRARSLSQVDLSAASEVDMDKVNAVRSSIEQGTYKVNPEAIADKLLANAKEQLDRSR